MAPYYSDTTAIMMKLNLRNLALVTIGILLMLPCCASAVSRQTYTQVVNKAVPTIQLTPSATTVTLTDKVTFTARVSGDGPEGPRGKITFTATSDSNNTLSSTTDVDSRGQASWTTDFAVGQYQVSSAYSGDGNYLTASSSPVPLTATPAPDFSLGVDDLLALQQGQSGQTTIRITSLNGFTGDVHLTCATSNPTISCGLPQAPTASVVLPGAAAAASSEGNPPLSVTKTSTLSVTTTPTTVTAVSASVIGFVGLLGIGSKRRRRLFVLLALGSLLLLCVGCGNPRRYVQKDGTPTGTYDVVITGTSGSLTHSTTLHVMVR